MIDLYYLYIFNPYSSVENFLCVVINVLTYVNQNRNHLAVLDFST